MLFTFCVHVYRGVYVYTHFVFVCVETRERERGDNAKSVSGVRFSWKVNFLLFVTGEWLAPNLPR